MLKINAKHIAILFILVLIPFAYYSLRSDIIGYDGYYYLNAICEKDEFRNEPPLSYMLFSLLPCDIFIAKVLLFLCCFLSAVFLGLSAELYNKKHGWKAGFLAFLSGIFFFEFMKFENDQFAYPFIFLATYFFLKSFQDNQSQWKNQLICTGLLTFSAGMWPGALIYLLILSLVPATIYLKMVIFPLLIPFGYGLVNALIGYGTLFTGGIAENTPLVAARWLGILPLGMAKWPKHTKLLIPGVLSLLLALFNMKFALFALPFMAIGLIMFFNYDSFLNVLVMYMVQITAIILIIFSFLFILPQPPTDLEHQAAQFMVDEVDANETIKNDWYMGYLIKWYGGEERVICCFGGAFSRLTIEPGDIVLTRQNLNCPVLKNFGDVNAYQC